MARFVAFLRAINVGGHTVKMDRLRDLFESAGFEDVSTFIASGNVIFDTNSSDPGELEDRIEAHLASELGYEVVTFLRTPAELAAIAAYEPPGSGDEGVKLHVGFLKAEPVDSARKALRELEGPEDGLHLHGRELYWLRHGRMSDSKLTGAMFERALAMPSTMRNANTVRRIAAKYPP